MSNFERTVVRSRLEPVSLNTLFIHRLFDLAMSLCIWNTRLQPYRT